MKKHLTKRTIEAAAPVARDVFLWDATQAGFGVKITPAGRRVYIFQYSRGGRDRRCTIGVHGDPLTLEEARAEARHLRGLVAKGQDPAVERARMRRLPTVSEFAIRYLAEHAELHKKARSAYEDRRLLENHLVPLLGHMRIDEVSAEVVARAVRDIGAGKTARDTKTVKPHGRRIVRGGAIAANRALAVLSKMFNLAEIWGLRSQGSNPCRHVTRFAENRRQRFLSRDEFARLGQAMAQAEAGMVSKTALAAITLLLFTGCRLREILDLQWQHVDAERRLLHLPDSKTGAKSVYLAPPALAVLSRLERRPGWRYVLPRAGADKPLASLQAAWGRLREVAGLGDVRLHDLRHSFASTGAAGGLSLPVIGALLGHTHTQTTARYAHLVADPLHKAADLIGTEIEAAMMGIGPAATGRGPRRES
jgi:integrase